MDALRGNRKVLPNYLLDDYAPSSDTKPITGRSSSSSLSHPATVGESSCQTLDRSVGSANGLTGAEDSSDVPGGPFDFLPRRKKKLRQACVYCRRSHLVCEEKRPCHRCVKRGIADRCVDPPQEGQLLQENGGSVATDTRTDANTLNDAYGAAPSAAASTSKLASSSSNTDMAELVRSDGGQKRKRTTKSENPRSSSAESHQQLSQAAPLPHHSRPHDRFELSHAATSFVPAPDYAPSHQSPATAGIQGPALSNAMPGPSISHPAPIPHSMPTQADPSVTARAAPSQLLQGQPIFQPPSSAELDSLFSTYFFDVADAFSARQNGVHHPGISAPHPPGHAASLYAHQHQPTHQTTHPPAHPQAYQQAHFAPNDPRHDGFRHHADTTPHVSHDHHVDPFTPSDSDARTSRSNHPVTVLQQHQSRRPDVIDSRPIPPAMASTHAAGPTSSNASALSSSAMPGDSAPAQIVKPRGSIDGQDALGRQRPGDVYAPYPYRKGYASLMRYMTEQNWSEQSIRSVEAALSKIRRLWFSLEDNIQPSSMIQLQAEWAGNVRYFSESVLPFTPIPMVVCRKAGEVYASNQLAQDLCGRSRHEMTGGRLSCYELMTENSASEFFRLYELAVGGAQAEDGSYVPTVGKTAPLYWNAEIVQSGEDGNHTVLPTRGIFEMKIAPCGLPSLLVCCFVPLS